MTAAVAQTGLVVVRQEGTDHGGPVPAVAGSPPSSPTKRQLVALVEQVRRRYGAQARKGKRCASGLAALDAALGGGFMQGAIHELLDSGTRAAARSVALLAAGRAAEEGRWIFYIDTQQDFYPPAAAQLSVPLERLIVLRVSRRAEALWAFEQSLRCPGVGAAVLPLRRLEMQLSRRLQLAAEAGGSLGLLLSREVDSGFTFVTSRLRLEPQADAGRGRRVRVTVLKQRDGPADRQLELVLPEAPDVGRGALLTPAPARGLGSVG
ncbi:MAG: hypothetical protein PVJ57_01050 [Phycisphaerae bacterium]|jgi:hypothetical protein